MLLSLISIKLCYWILFISPHITLKEMYTTTASRSLFVKGNPVAIKRLRQRWNAAAICYYTVNPEKSPSAQFHPHLIQFVVCVFELPLLVLRSILHSDLFLLYLKSSRTSCYSFLCIHGNKSSASCVCLPETCCLQGLLSKVFSCK